MCAVFYTLKDHKVFLFFKWPESLNKLALNPGFFNTYTHPPALSPLDQMALPQGPWQALGTHGVTVSSLACTRLPYYISSSSQVVSGWLIFTGSSRGLAPMHSRVPASNLLSHRSPDIYLLRHLPQSPVKGHTTQTGSRDDRVHVEI